MADARIVAYRLQTHIFAYSVRIMNNIVADGEIGIGKNLFLCRFLCLGSTHASRSRLFGSALSEREEHEFAVYYLKARARKSRYHRHTARKLRYIIGFRNENTAYAVIQQNIARVCRLGFASRRDDYLVFRPRV